MTTLKYDEELPFAVVAGDPLVTVARFKRQIDAVDYTTDYVRAEVVDTTPVTRVQAILDLPIGTLFDVEDPKYRTNRYTYLKSEPGYVTQVYVAPRYSGEKPERSVNRIPIDTASFGTGVAEDGFPWIITPTDLS